MIKILFFSFILFFSGEKGSKSGGPPDKQMLIAAAIGVAISLYILYQGSFKEITMKEFFQNYLSSGVVSLDDKKQ